MKLRRLGIAIALLALVAPASAQDSNYWNLKHGTKSRLLGGAVIGSVTDLGATFYNPGMLALIERPEFVISGRVHEYQRTTLEDGAGEGRDLVSDQFKPAPDMVAGIISYGGLGKNVVSYSILTRQRYEFSIKARGGGEFNVISSQPGNELFGAELIAEGDTSETWFGMTAARKLGKGVALGISTYLTRTDQDRRIQTLSQVLATGDDVGLVLRIREFDYYNWGATWKAGIGVDKGPLSFGLTVTTPSLNISGGGEAFFSDTVAGIDIDNDGIDDESLTSSLQEDLDVTTKSPWAVGLGAGYQFEKFKIHGAVEWYQKVDRYDVLTTSPFVSQTTGKTLENRLIDERNQVVNFGAALEYSIKDRVDVFAGFARDNSYRPDDRTVNGAFSSWDLTHISTGFAVKLKKFDLTLGVGYAFGNSEILESVDLTDPDIDSIVNGSQDPVHIDYKAFTGIFGFGIKL